MFYLDKNLFITNTNDLIEAIKPKKLLTMRNCQNYAKRIIVRLREEEEEERYINQEKNINLNNDKDNIDISNNIKASNDIKEGGSKEKQNTSSSNESIL